MQRPWSKGSWQEEMGTPPGVLVGCRVLGMGNRGGLQSGHIGGRVWWSRPNMGSWQGGPLMGAVSLVGTVVSKEAGDDEGTHPCVQAGGGWTLMGWRGNSKAVQWLGLKASTARARVPAPRTQGTKILHAVWLK